MSVESDYPDEQSQEEVFTYDPENRRTQEDIFTWDAANQDWVASSTLKFVYNGSQMVAELNGQNQLLQSYAWGPDGRLLSITDYSGGTPTNYQIVTDGSSSMMERRKDGRYGSPGLTANASAVPNASRRYEKSR